MMTANPIEIALRHTASAPVDLIAMAEALGARLQIDRSMDDSQSGRIERTGSGFRITLNGSHAPTRQRFTLAHELAHLLLHRDLIGDGVADDALYRSGLSNDLERQANRFAADLLMPVHLVRRVSANGSVSPAELARLFDVSEKAAQIRLRELGLDP